MENITNTELKKVFEDLEARAGNMPDRTLKRMRLALSLLDIKPIKVINVVGTNGKGTVASGLFEIFKSFGLNVGLYTSPHLQRYGERIKTKDGEISDAKLVELVIKVNKLEASIKKEVGDFTYFEVLTLAAMLYFKEKNITLAIVEAGVGGRFDASKAIETSFLQIITSISIDHTTYLGTSVEEIARHKAGILNGSTAITLNQGIALEVIKEEAKKTKTDLYTIKNFDFYKDKEPSSLENLPTSGEFSISFLDKDILINPKQFGVFRGENYALVFASTLLACKHLNIDINEAQLKSIQRVINHSTWIGRTQVINENPLTILDGAHNVDAIKKLYSSVKTIKHKKIISIVAMMDTKQHELSTSIIRKESDIMIVTNNGDNKSVNLELLKKEANADMAYMEITEAIRKARKLANKEDIIVICGSLYLVGLVLDFMDTKQTMR